MRRYFRQCGMTSDTLAIQSFRSARGSADQPQYIFQRPREQNALIGLGCHRKITFSRDGFHITADNGPRFEASVGDPIAQMRGLLAPDFPSFWMISPDLGRPVEDPDLPLIICIQPKCEVTIDDFGVHDRTGQPIKMGLAQDWDTQSDGAFSARLEQGIETLRTYPAGKMILTRSYQRTVGNRDTLALFSIFSASEPSAACNHFLQIDNDITSLGCSPENVFEIRGGQLVFDVVAGTRGISPDPDVDARWRSALESDAKERREHLMAFERYQARIETLITPGSLAIAHQLGILELGNVRHLYSKASGNLRAGLNWATILADSIPALISYPDALQPLADPGTEPLRYYSGVLGRVAANGEDAAFFLNLRAALVKQGTLYTQGGVGVIAESEPAKEMLEVKNKLAGLFKAVAQWENETRA